MTTPERSGIIQMEVDVKKFAAMFDKIGARKLVAQLLG
jgi:hypothetical protein